MFQLQDSVGRGGRNRKDDVTTAQHLLNTAVCAWLPMRPIEANGVCNDATIAAIEQYEGRVFGPARVSGLLTPHCGTLRALVASLGAYPSGPLTQPPWLAIACAEEGAREVPGLRSSNARILEYIASYAGLSHVPFLHQGQRTGYTMSQVDETPWCACFVNWCLQQVGKPRMGSASARSFLHVGQPSGPQLGAITIIYRKVNSDSATGWHVGFWIGGSLEAPVLLGGNQNNRVCRKQFIDLEQVYYRWPN